MSKIVWRGLTGSRRRDLYLFASVSGFRREEIAALDVTAFAADKSSVRYKAEDDKSRRGGTQPLPPGKMGTVTLPTSGKAWPGTWSERSADMVKIDLKATGIQYETEEGFFDFQHPAGAVHYDFGEAWRVAGDGPEVGSSLGPEVDLGDLFEVRDGRGTDGGRGFGVSKVWLHFGCTKICLGASLRVLNHWGFVHSF